MDHGRISSLRSYTSERVFASRLARATTVTDGGSKKTFAGLFNPGPLQEKRVGLAAAGKNHGPGPDGQWSIRGGGLDPRGSSIFHQ
jgi:hypothetical protein